MAVSKNARGRARPTYNELQKIAAVTAMWRVSPDHSISIEAQEAARAIVGAQVSLSQLKRWTVAYSSKIEAQDDSLKVREVNLPEIVKDTSIQVGNYERSLAEDYLTVNRLALNALKRPGFIDGSTDPRNVATVAGIATDKLLKLANLTGDVLDRLMALKELTPRKGYSLLEALDDLIHAYESMPDVGKATPFTVDEG